MTPGQHFIVSWVVANGVKLDRRSRVVITLGGLLPDLDGFGYLVDRAAPLFGLQTNYYEIYHHLFLHNLLAGVLLSAAGAWFCTRRIAVFWLCLLAFHLHLAGDLAGSMGPDGYQWPIWYLNPFNANFELTWSGQWELSSWKNSAIGVTFFVVAMIIARYRQVTLFEFFSLRFERRVRQAAIERGFFKLD